MCWRINATPFPFPFCFSSTASFSPAIQGLQSWGPFLLVVFTALFFEDFCAMRHCFVRFVQEIKKWFFTCQFFSYNLFHFLLPFSPFIYYLFQLKDNISQLKDDIINPVIKLLLYLKFVMLFMKIICVWYCSNNYF